MTRKNSTQIKVQKRNGKLEDLNLNKITSRIEQQTYNLDRNWIEPFEVAKKVIDGVYDGVTTSELDKLAAETAASLTGQHSDYAKLASRLAITSLHKETSKSFSETIEKLYTYINPETGDPAPLISDEVYEITKKYADKLDSVIVHSRDFNHDYFGFKTLEKSYLLKIDKKPVERPQYMWLRVALGIWGDNIDRAVETYDMMSQGYYTHATPTLFNAGTPRPQMSSCFLLALEDDSIDGIFNTLSDCAQISKWAGGIGLSMSNLRGEGGYIRGTNGHSNGLIPVLRIYNNTARCVDQGGGRRKGSFAIYMEPWHSDIMAFLDIRKNQGAEEMRCRDLFTAMWVPDLFMEHVDQDKDWWLMDPNESKGLQDVYGEEFNKLYMKYVEEGKFRKVVKARDIWFKILESQIETGTPYISYKDVVNNRSNQKNIGTIRSSNLCNEIVEFSGTNPNDGEKEIAVCNLASIALSKYIKGRKHLRMDYEKLWEATYHVVENLDEVIDKNYYPVEATRTSNMKHRPIAVGVQGLADVFFKLKIAFDSEEASKINKKIFETMYHAALSASTTLAKRKGSYKSFQGSPASQGILQFDMWGIEPDMYDWNEMKERIKKDGLRNSLLLAMMPTASTSQILGNIEACEPITSNIFTRRVLSGEYIVTNKYLIEELCELGLWGDETKNDIIRNDGSVQGLDYIPQHIQDRYKTIWEISQKTIIDMAADRGAFIDQTQSMNLFVKAPNFAKLTSMHFYAWGKRKLEGETDEEGNAIYYRPEDRKLKTGCYYLRSRAASEAIKFTVTKKEAESIAEEVKEQLACSLDDPDSCESCGS